MSARDVLVHELEVVQALYAPEARADAILSTLHDAGYVVAPREPTEAMINAAIDRPLSTTTGKGDLVFYGAIYRAMVDSLNRATDKQIAAAIKESQR